MKPLRHCADERAAPPSGFGGSTPRTLPLSEEISAGNEPGPHARGEAKGAPCAQTVFPRFSAPGNSLFSAEALPFNDSAL